MRVATAGNTQIDTEESQRKAIGREEKSTNKNRCV